MQYDIFRKLSDVNQLIYQNVIKKISESQTFHW